MRQSSSKIRQPRRREMRVKRSVDRLRPTDLVAETESAIDTVEVCIDRLKEAHHDPIQREANMGAITQALQEAEKSIQTLATHSETQAHEFEEARSMYMIVLDQVESLISLMDEKSRNEDLSPIELYIREGTEERIQELLDIRDDVGLKTPQWVITFLAQGIGSQAQEIYMHADLREDDPMEEALDSGYEDAVVAHTGFDRRESLRNLIMGMFLRAAKHANNDELDRQGNRYRANNTLQHIESEWEQRYPSIALKYRELQRYFDDIIQLIDGFYYIYESEEEEDPVQESFPVFNEEKESIAEEELQRRLQSALVAVSQRAFHLRSNYRNERHILRMEIEEGLTIAENVLQQMDQQENISEELFHKAEDRYMHIVLHIELLLNQVDERRQEKSRDPITKEWIAPKKNDPHLQSVERTAIELESDIPKWIIAYLARDIIAPQEHQQYLKNGVAHEREEAIDHELKELLEAEQSIERRLRLDKILEHLVLRAIREHGSDRYDNQGNIQRIHDVCHALREEWHTIMPQVEEKYEQIAKYGNEIVQLVYRDIYSRNEIHSFL